MKPITIVYSGKKQSGKNSAAVCTVATFINKIIKEDRYSVGIDQNNQTILHDTTTDKRIDIFDHEGNHQLLENYRIKTYSFADPLKQFLIQVFGLDYLQCYGTDINKNSKTHILWDSISPGIKKKYSNTPRAIIGPIAARQLMEIFGTDICRKIDENCWARGLYNRIEKDGYDLSIITDARFPNEIAFGEERDAVSVRLLRDINAGKLGSDVETALDDFPLGEYTYVIRNQNKPMKKTHSMLKQFLLKRVFNF